MRPEKYELKLDPLKIGGIEISHHQDRGGGEWRRRAISIRAMPQNKTAVFDIALDTMTAKAGKGGKIRYRREYLTMEIPREHLAAFMAEIEKVTKAA